MEDSSTERNEFVATDDDLHFVLAARLKSNSRPRHPPIEHIHLLWQVFVENVDPMTKVIHVPTIRPVIEKAVSNLQTIPRGFEALMFAIYSMAVVSLNDDECKQRLGEPRKALLPRFLSATELALSRANFMGTSSLIVLQALVLHILSVRDIYEPRAMWSLTGVAVRIAQGMGLERDGLSLSLPPFETEMRRRLWWLLKTHDHRTAELCGLAKFRDLDTSPDSTKWPTNINDDQLHQGMSSLPEGPNDKVTDMVFVAWRDELAKFTAGRITMFRRQGKAPVQWELRASGSDEVEIGKACKELEDIFETKYLRYCDPSQPLHLMTMLMGRFAMNVIRFLTHHPRRWDSIEQTPRSERQFVWETCIKLLEQYNMMLFNPQLKQFSWQAAYFQQWHALIHVLDTLRAYPLIANADNAWQAIANFYEGTPDMIFGTKKPIHVAVGNLCLKAYSDREAVLQAGDTCSAPTPAFIVQLRRQREVVGFQRQERHARYRQPEDGPGHGHPADRKMGPKANTRAINVGDDLNTANTQQSPTSVSPSLIQTGSTVDDNSFWSVNGLDDWQLDNLDSMNMEWSQDHNTGENNAQSISWEQWDTWLVDYN